MPKLKQENLIRASAETVWHHLFSHGSYEKWTSSFSPGSTYEGEWQVGGYITFLDGSGKGMVAKVAAMTKPTLMSFIHWHAYNPEQPMEALLEQAKTEGWHGSEERYELHPQPDGTTLLITSTDVPDKWVEPASKMWDDGLAILKQLCEAE